MWQNTLSLSDGVSTISLRCANILNNDIISTMNLTSLNGTAYDFHLVFNTRTIELYMYADMSMIEHSRKNSKYNKLNKILDL